MKGIKNLKKYLIFYWFVMLMIFSFTACGSGSSNNLYQKNQETKSDQSAVPSVSAETIAPAETIVPTEAIAAEATKESVIVQPAPEEADPAVSEVSEMSKPEYQEKTEQNQGINQLNQIMYAKRDLNVRTGDHQNTALLGSLTGGQEVHVTGKSASTGWYRIDFNGQDGFVSDKYLQENKPDEQSVQASVKQSEQALTKQEEQQEAAQEIVQQPATKNKTDSSAEGILNSVALNPGRSGFEPLDAVLDNLLPQILTADMNTYQKVKACYDYLIQNCSYGMNEGVNEYIEYYFFGYADEVSAYGMLTGHVGVCDDYSAAFAAMMKAVGLDCRVTGGQTTRTNGEYTPHAWCVMNLNGTEYIFDPQVEDNIAKGGAIQYYRFCKRYDEVPGKYIT